MQLREPRTRICYSREPIKFLIGRIVWGSETPLSLRENILHIKYLRYNRFKINLFDTRL